VLSLPHEDILVADPSMLYDELYWSFGPELTMGAGCLCAGLYFAKFQRPSRRFFSRREQIKMISKRAAYVSFSSYSFIDILITITSSPRAVSPEFDGAEADATQISAFSRASSLLPGVT